MVVGSTPAGGPSVTSGAIVGGAAVAWRIGALGTAVAAPGSSAVDTSTASAVEALSGLPSWSAATLATAASARITARVVTVQRPRRRGARSKRSGVAWMGLATLGRLAGNTVTTAGVGRGPVAGGGTVAGSRPTSHTPQRRQNAWSAPFALPQSQHATLPHSAQVAPSGGR